MSLKGHGMAMRQGRARGVPFETLKHFSRAKFSNIEGRMKSVAVSGLARKDKQVSILEKSTSGTVVSIAASIISANSKSCSTCYSAYISTCQKYISDKCLRKKRDRQLLSGVVVYLLPCTSASVDYE